MFQRSPDPEWLPSALERYKAGVGLKRILQDLGLTDVSYSKLQYWIRVGIKGRVAVSTNIKQRVNKHRRKKREGQEPKRRKPGPDPEWLPTAKRLREEGFSWSEVARSIGEHKEKIRWYIARKTEGTQ